MSCFTTGFAALSDSEREIDRVDNDEVADGVFVERRSVLWLSAASVAALIGGAPAARAQQGTKTPGSGSRKLSFQQFLDQVYPLTKKLVASDGKDEQAYLMTVAAAMSRIADPAASLRSTMRDFMRKHREDGKRFPLAAVSLRLRPGRGFTHHDHRDYNGVIMGIEGEVRVRNYDILGEDLVPPDGKTFQIRETRDDLILPGRFSTLGRRRDNVHDLVAGPDGGRVLDVFTYFEKGARSFFLDVEKKPRDAERRVYDAAWKTRRRRRQK